MGRIMGLDVGDKTIGVAISDMLGWTAQGLITIIRKSRKDDFQQLKEIIDNNEIEKIVVGLPKNMNGSIGPQGDKVIEYSELLKRQFNLEVVLWDERLSTVAAERALISADVSRKKRKQVIDKMAAVYILQGYLDRK